MTTTNTDAAPPALTGERADLLAALAQRRWFLRFTVQNLDDEQASRRTTVSELTLAGLVKHVADMEHRWLDFVLVGAAAFDGDMTARAEEFRDGFRLLPGETLAGTLDRLDEVARRTERIIAEVADLTDAHPLPVAPWFEPGASWSVRQVLLHLIAETAQHCGHADILREALDGARTMG
ncbi:DinB family protein [Frankia sp. AiPs1]|uniref:DinB family protein n=1 Tax=Frankia sp. AiPs1 TaxID=573493 RepID=UPI002042F19F|nr:DinB family protein [Frankia sp. AiPs1]MCM3925353.1 DinB family protein [Frankia sp. AiPs1]